MTRRELITRSPLLLLLALVPKWVWALLPAPKPDMRKLWFDSDLAAPEGIGTYGFDWPDELGPPGYYHYEFTIDPIPSPLAKELRLYRQQYDRSRNA